jgi:hypothetical protein
VGGRIAVAIVVLSSLGVKTATSASSSTYWTFLPAATACLWHGTETRKKEEGKHRQQNRNQEYIKKKKERREGVETYRFETLHPLIHVA